MQEINLLQTRTRVISTTQAWENQSKIFLIILWLALLGLAIAGGGLFYLTNQAETKSASVTQTNTQLENQLLQKQGSLNEAKVLQAQLQNLDQLISNHIYISGLLNEIEKMTYQKAQYLTMNASENGTVRLEGRTASYTDLGRLLLGLSTGEQFTNVKLLTATPSKDETNSYIFAIEMLIKPSVFHKK